jgi:hypothetical protein
LTRIAVGPMNRLLEKYQGNTSFGEKPKNAAKKMEPCSAKASR